MDLLEKDDERKAAVEELGLDYFVSHMVAHLAPHGRAVNRPTTATWKRRATTSTPPS